MVFLLCWCRGLVGNARSSELCTRVDEHLVELIDRGYDDGLACQLSSFLGRLSRILDCSNSCRELITGYLGRVRDVVDDFVCLSRPSVDRCLVLCSTVVDGRVRTVSYTIDCLVSHRHGVVDGGTCSIVDGELRTSEVVGSSGCALRDSVSDTCADRIVVGL